MKNNLMVKSSDEEIWFLGWNFVIDPKTCFISLLPINNGLALKTNTNTNITLLLLLVVNFDFDESDRFGTRWSLVRL